MRVCVIIYAVPTDVPFNSYSITMKSLTNSICGQLLSICEMNDFWQIHTHFGRITLWKQYKYFLPSLLRQVLITAIANKIAAIASIANNNGEWLQRNPNVITKIKSTSGARI